MDLIKEHELEESLRKNGLKLYYRNADEDGKAFKDHIEVLNNLYEDFQKLKIYVIQTDTDKSTRKTEKKDYEFMIYDGNNLIKSFKNPYIGDVVSFIRKFFMSYENSTNVNTAVVDKKSDIVDDIKKEDIESDVIKRIKRLLNEHPIILFMKGSKDIPKCKFSNAVVEMLNCAKIRYDTYDILEDEELRNELKNYSKWPTYPQLYVFKELIGGHDIIKEMFETNQLSEVIPTEYIDQ